MSVRVRSCIHTGACVTAASPGDRTQKRLDVLRKLSSVVKCFFFFLIKVAFKYYCFPLLVTVSVLSDNTNECLLCARQCTKCCGEQKAFCDLIII